MLANLIEAAGELIVILPGAGIIAANIRLIVRSEPKAREFHSGLGTALPYGSREYKRLKRKCASWQSNLRESAATRPLER